MNHIRRAREHYHQRGYDLTLYLSYFLFQLKITSDNGFDFEDLQRYSYWIVRDHPTPV